ncbi:hypothetical protein NFJ02_02g75130 [Pycnococcus provasolii]
MAPSSSAAASRVLAILLDTSLTPLDCLTLVSSELVSAASPELSLDVEINQTTPLIAAASTGHGPDLVTSLLSQNYCSANFVTSTGNTALRAATTLGDGDVMKALIQGGASVDLETSRGTCLIAACALTSNVDDEEGAAAGSEVDVALQADVDHARHQGDAAAAALLLGFGADPNKEIRSGMTALHAAVKARNLSAAKVLLERGADARRPNADGISALDLCEKTADVAMASVLCTLTLASDSEAALAASKAREADARRAADAEHEAALAEVKASSEIATKEVNAKVAALRAETEQLRARFMKRGS